MNASNEPHGRKSEIEPAVSNGLVQLCADLQHSNTKDNSYVSLVNYFAEQYPDINGRLVMDRIVRQGSFPRDADFLDHNTDGLDKTRMLVFTMLLPLYEITNTDSPDKVIDWTEEAVSLIVAGTSHWPEECRTDMMDATDQCVFGSCPIGCMLQDTYRQIVSSNDKSMPRIAVHENGIQNRIMALERHGIVRNNDPTVELWNNRLRS